MRAIDLEIACDQIPCGRRARYVVRFKGFQEPPPFVIVCSQHAAEVVQRAIILIQDELDSGAIEFEDVIQVDHLERRVML